MPAFRADFRETPPIMVETGLAGWGGRIRTSEWRNQNPLPYHLATPHRCSGIAADDTGRIEGDQRASRLPARRTRGYIRPSCRHRSVAQPGSAPRSGRGGRRFKSCHSDHFSAAPNSDPASFPDRSPGWPHPGAQAAGSRTASQNSGPALKAIPVRLPSAATLNFFRLLFETKAAPASLRQYGRPRFQITGRAYDLCPFQEGSTRSRHRTAPRGNVFPPGQRTLAAEDCRTFAPIGGG
jgi:hypothetical protein